MPVPLQYPVLMPAPEEIVTGRKEPGHAPKERELHARPG